MLDLFMFTDILISYCDNNMTVNYNSILNTVNELYTNKIIDRYYVYCRLNDETIRTIKMYVDGPKDTTLYEAIITLLDNNNNCIINSISIKNEE